jgi:hypothetical protein
MLAETSPDEKLEKLRALGAVLAADASTESESSMPESKLSGGTRVVERSTVEFRKRESGLLRAAW